MGKHAVTDLHAVAHLKYCDGVRFSLGEVRIHTGRTHQIRVHLSNEGVPIVGDEKYGAGACIWCQRVFLHACYICFEDCRWPIEATCSLPGDLRAALSRMSACDARSHALLRA